MRGNPDLRILAFGHWGTYKRLETLMAAFPSVLKKVPNARLIVAGGNHPTRAGYWESIRQRQPAGLPIEFRGYIPQQDIPELFRTSSVLVMPYNSSTGSSGPAHQACEYGIPIVCADISDFRCMAVDDDMAINFYRIGDTADLAEKLVAILQSPDLQRHMAEHNYQAGIQMTMASVVRNYLRWFELHQCKRTIINGGALTGRRRWLRLWPSRRWTPDTAFFPTGADASATLEVTSPARTEIASSRQAESPSPRKPLPAIKHARDDEYNADPELENVG
jgi:Glycosyl transferases group 1